MDAELKQYLDEMKRDLDASIAASEERIVVRVSGQCDASIAASEARIMARVNGQFDAQEDRLRDLIRKSDFDLETKLSSEFWKWGRGSEVRTREAINVSGEASSRVQLVSERLLNVEERVSALERGRM
jgi:hypothetical protein